MTKTIVSPQIEFEAATLLFMALKPLSPKARTRVVAFVQAQLAEDEGIAPARMTTSTGFWSLMPRDGSDDE